MDQALIQYYLKELAQLEDDCAEFSVAHPQVAGRLTLGNTGASDPMVKQLIESLAFIAARLKRHMDGLSGEIIYTLLQLICPHLIRPLPCMGVVRFMPASPGLDILPTAVVRGALLNVAPRIDGQCLMTAPAGANLWPFTLKTFWAVQNEGRDADLGKFSSENCFIIRITSQSGKINKNTRLDLPIFISGPLNRALAALEAFAIGVREIHVRAVDGSWTLRLPNQALKLQRFGGVSTRLIPTPTQVENLGNMVLEYLTFPQHFCFFEINGLVCPAPCAGFDIALVLEPKAVPAIDAAKNNLLLNCVPVVNLYPRNHVPVGMHNRQENPECLIPADPARSGAWDVHSINQVRIIGKQGDFTVPEYFSTMSGFAPHTLNWVESRRERIGQSFTYASAVISFVDAERQPHERSWEDAEVALLDLNCSNTTSPERLNVGQHLDASSASPNYLCMMETTTSSYVGPALPQATKMGQLLRAFSFRCGTPDLHATVTATVRNYLQAHNRANTVFAQAQINGLLQIERHSVALPLAFSVDGGALAAGFRYDILFNEHGQLDPGKYLLGKIIKALLEQMADGSTPLEVWVHDATWGALLVE
jgi:type VI secretion system protein ImpG